MTGILHRDFEPYLNDLAEGAQDRRAPVYLFYGEEAIYQPALETLLNVLVPASMRKFNYEAFEGSRENVEAALSCLNTYSLSGGTKVVALLNADFFSSTGGDAAPSDTDAPSSSREIAPPAADAQTLLSEALSHGFPDKHILVITSETVDRRRRLFKTIHDAGLVVDCSVPKGDRRADKTAQQSVLAMKRDEILGRRKKRISAAAYAALYEMTGFDLRTFSNNLLKLMDYIGDREEISEADVLFVLNRTKTDPVYAFTDAVTDRHVDDGLFYLRSLLTAGFHPLQIMAALVNQMRRLIVVKSFVKNLPAGLWRTDLPYPAFQKTILPLMLARDKSFQSRVAAWGTAGGAKAPKTRHRTAAVPTAPKGVAGGDLLLVSNPKSPYPVYKSMQKADGFTMKALLQALRALSRADVMLKSSDHPPESVLTGLVISICGEETAVGQASG
jgi:DNA polymerase-3 subunit delta